MYGRMVARGDVNHEILGMAFAINISAILLIRPLMVRPVYSAHDGQDGQ
jgi:hypothetical protein